MKKIISKNPLFYAFLLPALVDGFVTLIGQDTSYWTNRIINEASPAYYFLLVSPWFFIAGSIVWFVFWYGMFKRLKEPWNLFLMFLFIVAHSWGSSSWIWRAMQLNGFYSLDNQLSIMFAWSGVVFYFAFIAILAAYCLRIYTKKLDKL